MVAFTLTSNLIGKGVALLLRHGTLSGIILVAPHALP